MKYFVTVGERTIEVVIDGDHVTVNGTPVNARLERVAHSPELRLWIDDVTHSLAIDQSAPSGTWRLVDRGGVHDVGVEDERHRHIRLLAGAGKAVDHHTLLKAPMPGLVLRILVAEGDEVGQGTPLLALEAMKMENELKAAAPGRVLAIRATVGAAVEKGQILLELGPIA